MNYFFSQSALPDKSSPPKSLQVEDILSTALASLVPLTPVELYNSVNALGHVEIPMQWGEFLMRFSSLSGFLVRRADDTLMFFHPTFREWLVRRKDFESKKFLCDSRNGHAAIAFRYDSQITFTLCFLCIKSTFVPQPPECAGDRRGRSRLTKHLSWDTTS